MYVGDATTLNWSSTHATSCTASGGWTGPRDVTGTQTIVGLAATTSFTLTCRNGALTSSATVSVQVQPAAGSVDFTVTPSVVHPGDSVTFTWTSTGMTECWAEGLGFNGQKPTQGSEVVPIPTSVTGYQGRVEFHCGGPYVRPIDLTRNFEIAWVYGRIVTPLGIFSDSDVNDPTAPYYSNDEFMSGVSLPTFGYQVGYVNMPGAGPPGRSFANGDVHDFYSIGSAQAGQVVRLLLPNVDTTQPVDVRDDVDLYLYDTVGTLLDASVGSDAVETVVLPHSENVIVEVRAVHGSAKYLISIEDPPAVTSLSADRLSADFVPGEAIVRSRAAAGKPQQAPDGRKTSGPGSGPDSVDRERRVLFAEASNTTSRAKDMPSGTSMPKSDLLRRKLDTLLQLKALRARSDIRTADLNRIVHANLEPTDPLYPRQRWNYEQLGLPAAWDVSTGFPGVTIAIVDSGFVMNHPDLRDKWVDGYDFVNNPSGLDGDGLDADPTDPGFNLDGLWIFHGTHVAGIAGATANNGTGGSGVAWGAHLMPLRALEGREGTIYDVLQAVRYAAGLANDSDRVPSRPADIINLSLGGPGSCSPTEADVFEQVQRAGIIVAAAAGNDSTSVPQSPASCPGVIAVGATGSSGVRAPYSNFGSFVSVLAPGGDMSRDLDGDGDPDGVLSTHASKQGSQTTPKYDLLQGTSMASPHAAGVFALMKSVKPALTGVDVTQLIESGLLTDDLGSPGRDDDGFGRLNAAKAMLVANGSTPTATYLKLAPLGLDFRNTYTELSFEVRKGGVGTISITGVRSSVPWASVAPWSTDAAGLGFYKVTVSRYGLPHGSHSGVIDIDSANGTIKLPITLTFLPYNVAPSPGRVYLRFLNATTGQVEKTYTFVPIGDKEFALGDLPFGRYTVVAGTDMNNDGNVCDTGELCGSYPVQAVPGVIDYKGVILDLAVQIGLTEQPPGPAGP